MGVEPKVWGPGGIPEDNDENEFPFTNGFGPAHYLPDGDDCPPFRQEPVQFGKCRDCAEPSHFGPCHPFRLRSRPAVPKARVSGVVWDWDKDEFKLLVAFFY